MINHMPIRVAVTGVTGRMGNEIIQCISSDRQDSQIGDKIVLGAAIVKPKSNVCGMSIRSLYPSNTSEIMIVDNIQLIKEHFDILIDFTTPKATMEYLNFCVMNQKNMIIGTTGLNKNHLSLIKSASRKIGIVCSANFSIGVTVMMKLLVETSRTIGNFVDIDIIETHHNKKNDLPSGTALMMQDIIKSNILKTKYLCKEDNNLRINDNVLQNELLYKSLYKSQNNVKIHSIRSGDIVGEHMVLFSGLGERLEIMHKASDRSVFANGALRSAIWLKDKRMGLFDLNSVLGFDKL